MLLASNAEVLCHGAEVAGVADAMIEAENPSRGNHKRYSDALHSLSWN